MKARKGNVRLVRSGRVHSKSKARKSKVYTKLQRGSLQSSLTSGQRSKFLTRWWIDTEGPKDRKEVLDHDFAVAHDQLLGMGARVLVEESADYKQIVDRMIAGKPLFEFDEGADTFIRTLLWGDLDLRELNSIAIEALQSGLPFYQLVFGVAILLNNRRIGPVKIHKHIKNNGVRVCNVPVVSWRDALFYLNHVCWHDYRFESGYDQFARDYFNGDSLKAYRAASSLLTSDEFHELDWGKQKQTHVNEQEEYRERLKDPKYFGEDGYDRFALEFFEGNLKKAYLVASSLLSKDEFAALCWGKQKVTRVGSQGRYKKILKDKKYQGEKGYDLFAIDYFEGDSKKAFIVASSLLSADDFTKLNWGKVKQTNVKEQEKYREALRDERYHGEAGYDQFAIDYFEGDLSKAFVVARSLLSADEFSVLNWGKQKPINVKDQDKYREALQDEIYCEEAGYDQFAIDYFQGNSQKAYLVASSLLSVDDFAELNWGKSKHTNVKDQEKYREALRDEKYREEAGYDQFAIDYFQGSSTKAYLVASSLLSVDDFSLLEWGKLKHTNVKDQEKYREALRDEKYREEAGYDQFAIDHFQGNSQKAYLVASSLLSADDFAELNWGKHKQTNVKEQEKYRESLKDEKYRGESGYDQFAIDYFQGNLQKAYHVASSLLSEDDFAELNWGKIKYTNVNEQEKYREALRDEKYREEAGYDQFAIDHFQGNSQKAYLVASSLLSADDFYNLNWGKAKHTNVKEQDKYREALKDEKYCGEAGYDQFAIDYFQGSSTKAYVVASSLLSVDDFAELNWGKQKQTNVKEQEKYREALRDEKYRRESGYDQFAIDYFQGNLQKAYHVASSLLSVDDFAELNWGKIKYTNVNEQEKYREALRDKKYREEAGYDQFAIDHFQGNSQKAYLVASSLLSADDFAELNWGKVKRTNVKEQEKYREALKDEKYREEAGYDQFAIDYFQGNSAKAYWVASSLLSADDFAELNWGKKKLTNVKEQDKYRKLIQDGSYIGIKGWHEFAKIYFCGDFNKARNHIRPLLNELDYINLKWDLRLAERLTPDDLEEFTDTNFVEQYYQELIQKLNYYVNHFIKYKDLVGGRSALEDEIIAAFAYVSIAKEKDHQIDDVDMIKKYLLGIVAQRRGENYQDDRFGDERDLWDRGFGAY